MWLETTCHDKKLLRGRGVPENYYLAIFGRRIFFHYCIVICNHLKSPWVWDRDSRNSFFFSFLLIRPACCFAYFAVTRSRANTKAGAGRSTNSDDGKDDDPQYFMLILIRFGFCSIEMESSNERFQIITRVLSSLVNLDSY